MGIFDSIQKTAFDVCANTFGYSATWMPSDSGAEAQSALVLYKDPTEDKTFNEHKYQVEGHVMEYKLSDFVGLKESVDTGTIETVSIVTDKFQNIVLSFNVRSVEKKFDGQTFVAHLSIIE